MVEQPQITDKQQLLDEIEDAIEYYEDTGNLWAAYAIVTLQEEYKKYFGDDGAEIPVTEPEQELAFQFSPEEAVNAEGWQTVYPKGFGKLPRRLRDTDPSVGLDISRSRSNGCFIVRNEREIADAWVNDPKAAADSISPKRASPRLILLAGTQMQGFRYMFPTFNFHGAGRRTTRRDYVFSPDIPFNDDEIIAFKDNFSRFHLHVAQGGLKKYADVQFNGVVGDPSGKHKVLTVANHPQWILPAAMKQWNTTDFMRKTYDSARRAAVAIDNGAPRIAGYTTPEQWGGGDTQAEWRKWRDRFEGHKGRSGLPFSLGG